MRSYAKIVETLKGWNPWSDRNKYVSLEEANNVHLNDDQLDDTELDDAFQPPALQSEKKSCESLKKCGGIVSACLSSMFYRCLVGRRQVNKVEEQQMHNYTS